MEEIEIEAVYCPECGWIGMSDDCRSEYDQLYLWSQMRAHYREVDLLLLLADMRKKS